MNQTNREIGYEGEALAEDYLIQHGYKILQKNYTVKGGEIDIIAKDGDYLVFIEVKHHSKADYGSMLEKINLKKQQNIIYAAKVYITQRGLIDSPCRFDVVTIERQAGGVKKVELIQDAFQVEYRV